MAKTEDIEAKLAAFVDGQLDSAGRAEIEAHLRENPQHRQLLDDLVEQRKHIQALPREKAPAEVTDSITAQLERSVLLSNVEEEVAASGRGHWRGIAAAIALTASLAAVIYALLPSIRQVPQIADIHTLPSTNPAPMSAPFAADNEPEFPTTRADSSANRSEQEQRVRVALNGSQTEQAASAITTQPTEIAAAPSQQIPTSLPASPIVIELQTADVPARAAQVAMYLKANGIASQQPPTNQQSIANLSESKNVAQSEMADQQIFVQKISRRQLEILQRVDIVSDQVAQAVSAAFPTSAPATQSFASGAATTRRAMPTIVPGDTLVIEIPELSAPGLDQKTQQQVSPAGTIALPMVDAIEVSGLTDEQASRAIAARYRDANLLPNARVRVDVQSSTQPATLPVENSSTDLTDDLVDAVIILRPTTAPATQPIPIEQPATNPTTLP